MVALSALVSGLDAELVRLGYKDSTMVWYRGCWRRLQRYFAARGVEEFSLDVAMAWVDEACGFFDKEQAGTLKPTDVYLFRVAQMLGEYAVHGAVLRRYSRTVSKLAGDGAEAVARFQAWLRAAERRRVDGADIRDGGRGVRRVRRHARRAGLAATPGRSGRSSPRWPDTRPRPSSRNCARCGRSCRFASGDGLVDAAVLEAVPAVHVPQAGQDPVGVGPGDVARILEAVDRGNPCGKRDYAIILLVTRLGLRGIDVKRLEFADFDWPGNRLSVDPGQDRPQGAAAAAEGRRLGGHRLRPPWPAGQRLPAGVPAAHRPDRPVLRPGPSAPDPGQARPGGARPGQREAPPRHALAAAHAGDPADGGRHAGRADRRHPRPPVRRSRPAST